MSRFSEFRAQRAASWSAALLPLAVLLLASCTKAPSASSSPDALPNASSPVATTGTLPPGRYCYSLNGETLSAVVRLQVASDQTLTGDSSATIADETQGYYSSYAQKISGQLSGDQAAVDLTTWIEYDVQTARAVWSVSAAALDTEQGRFGAIDCEQARASFAGPDGLEAADLLADTLPPQPVVFAPGGSTAVLEAALVRGERARYQISAEGGQQMNLALTSAEDNAVLDVISPSGLVLLREASQETLLLPQTGEYTLIVSSSRGNTSYQLRIEIP